MASLEDNSPVEPQPTSPIDEGELIKSFIDNTPLKEGDSWFVISMKWWRSWKNYTGFDYGTASATQRPDPIDNRDIIASSTTSNENQFIKLKLHLLDGVDYQLVPRQVWRRLITWYGGGPAIERQVIITGLSKRKMVEVYYLTLHVVHNAKPGVSRELTFSKRDTIGTLKKQACKAFGVAPEKAKIWNYYSQMKHEELKDLAALLDDAHLVDNQKILLEEEGVDLLAGKTTFGSGMGQSLYSTDGTSQSRSSLYSTNSSQYGVNSGLTGLSSTVSNALTPATARIERGLCGLHNLGNTCFMNSGLQCLNNTAPLVEYFLSGRYKAEINRSNPLGLGGRMAEAFGTLVSQMWSGEASSVAPRELKSVIAKFASQFSGYAQHDSQELLAFLLDGLHEDLNRVRDKPQTQMIESDGRPDAEVAEESWQNHLKRNRSVIVDLFQGQFKSTLVCPDCGKVSITFDPFMYLSLPLPGVSTRSMVVRLVRRTAPRPILYGVAVPKNGTIADLKTKLAHIAGLPSPHCLVACEVYQHKLHTFFPDVHPLDAIKDSDELFVYEVNDTPDIPVPDRILIYFQHRVLKPSSTATQPASPGGGPSNRMTPSYFGYPFVAVVSRTKTTTKVLRQLVWPRTSPFLSSASLPPSAAPPSPGPSAPLDAAAAPMEVDDLPKSDDDGLYVFKVIENAGSAGPVLVKTLEEDDDCTTLQHNHWIAIEWDLAVWRYRLDTKEALREDKHESVASAAGTGRRSGVTLDQCLQAFLTKEKLGANDPWYCPACKEFRQATKKFDLWRLPEVLVVHLKRFSFTRWFRDKLDTFVDFPITSLDLSPYTLGLQSVPPIYDLFAISNHYGGLGGGHYTAFAKNRLNSKWYCFDDSSVRSESENAIKTSAAYVLFYRRRDPTVQPTPTTTTSTTEVRETMELC